MQSRGYRQGDVEAMYGLDQECFSGPFQFDHETMQEAAEAESSIVVVVENDGGREMLGFLIVHAEGTARDRYAYIITIDVAAGTRQQGVGARMLLEAEDQARRAGLKRMGLHVAVDNVGAIAFYERLGYERVGREKGFYRQAGLDALIYAKQL